MENIGRYHYVQWYKPTLNCAKNATVDIILEASSSKDAQVTPESWIITLKSDLHAVLHVSVLWFQVSVFWVTQGSETVMFPVPIF